MQWLPLLRPSCPASLAGPFRNVLSVRSSGWFRRFEDCVLEIAVVQDLDETLSDMEVSVGDLVSVEDFASMAGPTFEFGESLIIAEDVAEMVRAGFFKDGRAKVPPAGQTVPKPDPGYAVIYRDYFT